MVTIFIRGMDLKPPIAGVTEDHHGLSHHGRNPAKIEQLRIVEHAKMAAFRDFLLALREHARKAAGTPARLRPRCSSAATWATPAATAPATCPILLAGGGMRHGQHVAGDPKNNTPLGKLFVSMLQRFGVETDTVRLGARTIDGLV